MTTRAVSKRGRSTAFTLIEILLASVAAAMILVIINGLFVQAIHLRDDATDRVRTTRLRMRAEHAIRDDLQSALVSGGILASTLDGGTSRTDGPGGASFPGYLKLTTTNGRSASGQAASDVQQVEYYITADPNAGAASANSGVLVRAVTRDLLATTPTIAKTETLLSGVQSMQVQFYDGTSWLDTWDFQGNTATAAPSSSPTPVTVSSTTLPEAIRVDIRLIAKAGDLPSPPVEVLVPWDTQPFVGATPAPSTVSDGTGASTGTGNNGQNGGQGGNNGPGGGQQPGRPPGGEGPGGPPPGEGPPGGQRPPPPGEQPPGEQPPTTGPGNRPPRR